MPDDKAALVRRLTTLALSEPGSGAHFYIPQARLSADGEVGLEASFLKMRGTELLQGLQRLLAEREPVLVMFAVDRIFREVIEGVVHPAHVPLEAEAEPVAVGEYQMMVRSEIIRARFRNSYERPEPLRPGSP